MADLDLTKLRELRANAHMYSVKSFGTLLGFGDGHIDLYRVPFGALRSEYIAAEELIRRAERLDAKVKEHNELVANDCHSRQTHGTCYTQFPTRIGQACHDCPRQYRIEVPTCPAES